MPALRSFRTTAAVTLLTAGLSGGLATNAPAATASEEMSSTADLVKKARHVALNQLGDAYQYGAEGPHRFDCSGLVYFSYRKAGLDDIPRTSDAQAAHADRIKKRKLRAGDLMFFHNDGDVYHVGIFVRWRDGEALMVHAPSTGGHVEKVRPWTTQWFAGTVR